MYYVNLTKRILATRRKTSSELQITSCAFHNASESLEEKYRIRLHGSMGVEATDVELVSAASSEDENILEHFLMNTDRLFSLLFSLSAMSSDLERAVFFMPGTWRLPLFEKKIEGLKNFCIYTKRKLSAKTSPKLPRIPTTSARVYHNTALTKT